MKHEQYEEAACYWVEREAQNVSMRETLLKEAMQDYIKANNTCALATGTGADIRCTPIEYVYWKECFYLFSEGGLKFHGLANNKHVSLAIFDKYSEERCDGFGNLKGMQVFGTASMVEPFTDEYIKVAEIRKIPLESLKQLPRPMYLIKITPRRIDYLNSDFKKEGYSSRQFLEYKNDN